MNGKTGNPRFGIDQRPPRPKSLRELYEFVVETCPSVRHNEKVFFDSIIAELERDPIRNRSVKRDVNREKLNLIFPKSWPLNDFWHAADRYLKSLNIEETEIDKFWKIVQDEFN